MCQLISECTESIKAITYLSSGTDGWWASTLAKKYFSEQERAIKERGVSITRIFIVSDQETENLRLRFTTHKNINIEVRAVDHYKLPLKLRCNFLICDDKWIIDSKFNREGINEGGTISKDKTDLNLGLEKWNYLLDLSELITDVNEYVNPFELNKNRNNIVSH